MHDTRKAFCVFLYRFHINGTGDVFTTMTDENGRPCCLARYVARYREGLFTGLCITGFGKE